MTYPPDLDVPLGSVLEVTHDGDESVTLHLQTVSGSFTIRLAMSREDLCSAVCATYLDEMAGVQP